MRLISESSSATHIGLVRENNEDSFLEKSEVGLWIIADGMGGHDAGDFASQMIVKTMDQLKLDPAQTPSDETTEKLKLALYSINTNLIELGKKYDRINGSTVVVMHINGEQCDYYWAGDSRLYLLRENELIQLTRDHSQAEIYVDLGMLTREEASKHVSTNILTRCIGTDKNLKVESDSCELINGDRFLLSSDGLDKHVSHKLIEETLNRFDREEAIQKLIWLALNDGGSDNITISIVDIMSE